MSEPAAKEPTGPTEPTEPAGPTDFERLTRFLTTGPRRFALAVVTSDHVQELADRRAEAANVARAAGKRVAELTVAPDGHILDQLSAAAQGADVLFVNGLDELLVDAIDTPLSSPRIEELNVNRDSLPLRLSTHTVLWLRQPAARALAQAARDLDDVVMMRVWFPRPWTQRAPAIDLGERLERWVERDRRAAVNAKRVKELDDVLATRERGSVEWAQAALARSASTFSEDPAGTIALLQEAKEIFERGGDRSAIVETLLVLALSAGARGDAHEVVQSLLHHALAVADAANNPLVKEQALLSLAYTTLEEDTLEAVRILRDEVLPLAIKRGDQSDLARIQATLARFLAKEGLLEEAHRFALSASELCESIGDIDGRAEALDALADIRLLEGDIGEALRIWRDDVLPAYYGAMDRGNRADIVRKVANAIASRGQTEDAEKLLSRLANELERNGETLHLVETLGDLGLSIAERGDLAGARELLEKAHRLSQTVSIPRVALSAAVNLAAVLLRQGDVARAVETYGEHVSPVLPRVDARTREDVQSWFEALALEKGQAGGGGFVEGRRDVDDGPGSQRQ